MALFYLDASALAKLVRREPESAALRTFLDGADIVSSELVLAEIPRSTRPRRDPVATALSATPLEGFVTYDERQGAAARLCGLRTIAPAG